MDDRRDQPVPARAAGRHDGDAGVDAVAAPRQCLETALRAHRISRLGQDPSTTGDDGIGGQHDGVVVGAADSLRLGHRQSLCHSCRQFPSQRRFVDVGRHNLVGVKADLLEKRQAPGVMPMPG